MTPNKRLLLLASARDAASQLLYYDRKEDEELTPDDVDELISTGAVTLAEITAAFAGVVLRNCPNIRRE